MPRIETRFGATYSLGTAYTALATIGAGTTANVLLNVTNRTTAGAAVRAYVATSSWSSGEPGTTTVAAIAYDYSVSPGEVFQVSGIVLNAGEKLIVRADTASSLDVIASGVAVS